MDTSTHFNNPPRRASSSEPSSTRPNPFDDSDIASRKRRRTSASVESLNQLPDNSSTSATLDEYDEEASDSAVKMDSDPATPKTPERASSSADHPPDPPSSRITINLRNDRLSDNSSSSPSHQLKRCDTSVDGQNTTHRATENEVDLVRESPGSHPSSPASGSPRVELIQELEDEDIDLGTPVEGVPLVGQNQYLVDPIERFPYKDSQEHLFETAQRLVSYISTQPLDPAILEDVQQWLDSYVTFLGMADSYSATRSFRSNRAFWIVFPEIVLALSSRRPALLRTPGFRPIVMKFYRGFIELTAYLVKFDIQSIRDAEASLAANQPQLPELFSGGYLSQLYSLTRRDAVVDAEQDPMAPDRLQSPQNDVRVILEKIKAAFGDGFGTLHELCIALIDILPNFPKLVDNLAFASQLLSGFLNEAAIRIQTAPSHEEVQPANHLLEQGHELWNKISACLSMLLEKHVTQVSNDGVSYTILALSEALKSCVTGTHETAVGQVEQHRQNHPQLPTACTPDAIALEWRFEMLGRLIRCSQMQLRVIGVTTMCSELVGLWKRLGEDPGNPLLKHVGQYLLRSSLIEYILGPNCHPEIMVESANIVGFLIVTKLYQKEHTDRIWHGITSSQDPRIADALTRMVNSITNLLDHQFLSHLCGKLEELPLVSFTPSIRALWGDHLMRSLVTKSNHDHTPLTYQPYNLCARLLRESSVCVNGSDVAHPELQHLAMQKFTELLKYGPDEAGRAELYRSCLEDVSRKTQTTLGSLWCLSMAIRSTTAHEMQILTEHHDLTRLVVEELEHAVQTGLLSGSTSVLSGNTNYPRREFVSNIIRYQPMSINKALGETLWDLLVGPRSLGREDREAGWKILNDIVSKDHGENLFVRTCLSRYLPMLPSIYFCEGTLEFVREEVLSLVKRNDEFHLDDESTFKSSCVEQLWRIVLTATDSGLVNRAVHTLAVEVYMDSQLLSAYPSPRARQVHSSLINRCFVQLRESANTIKAFREGSSDGDGDSMVIVATEDQIREQGRTFTRSLQFLRYFLETHQSKPQFAAPDLRPLMSRTPAEVVGDPAELKYQSFDGKLHTDIKPLAIGRGNTAAALLTKIKQETGFQNYRAYYRGQPLLPSERDVCKSLDDLKIHDGLILVKREDEEEDSGSFNYKPGSSSLQIEIMSHFEEMWEYLNLDEKLAGEIYHFLVRLPADISVMESIEEPAASYTDIFPPGQPFRSLYATHALVEYKGLAGQSRYSDRDSSGKKLPLVNSYTEARQRAVAFIVQAILDPKVTSHRTPGLELQVTSSLMQTLVQWLQDSDLAQTRFDAAEFGIESPERFMAILSNAAKSEEESASSLIIHTLAVILRLGLLDFEFRECVAASQAFREVSRSLVLFDKRKQVRSLVIKMIQEFADSEEERLDMHPDQTDLRGESHHRIARYFWALGLDLMPETVKDPNQCYEIFSLLHSLMRKVFAKHGHLVDLHSLAVRTSELLMSHESTEDINQVEPFDPVARGLASLLLMCFQMDESMARSSSLHKDLAYELYWRLLFPRTREQFEQPVPKVILNTDTRAKICEIILRLVKDDRNKFSLILNSINDVLPFFTRDEEDPHLYDPYLYDISGSFDRSKAMRAPCGYVGLRNLSNTCYLNSLLTQLYMHTGFRRFIMSANVTDAENTQDLLYHTKKTFGFMQESYRRFVDPCNFVQSIKTYDDTLIDIHNQMDVDEFYNLLFDRWEGQLQSSIEKRQLRSFYGGQLVQQVKSKECEHISERLEPFSAIQCDVKGKKSLQESLQAYVDGEVLEGDNKYKCSTCDRHVDAVKRACLKDLPDNMIFHLKRFDFSLKTLQRSKINDYFTFPERIDLKPYTVEHLSDPTIADEDIFELVGVLVHAGTAESGHYYSYIRERPSAADRPSWVEFNDDNVTPWDPAFMEASTFGGPDYRPSFETNGIVYDKPYSAYMLFYQRASSLRKQQEEAVENKIPIPAHVDVDGEQKEYILDENTNLLRRHCLFDPSYAPWVRKFFDVAANLDLDATNLELMDDGTSSDDSTPREKLQDLAMEVLLSHFDQIVSRKKELPDFSVFMATLDKAVEDSAEAAYSLYKYFFLRPAAFRSLIQRNSEPIVRQRTSQLFLRSLRKISSEMPQYYASTTVDDLDSDGARLDKHSIGQSLASGRHGVPVLGGVMYIFRHLWRHFHVHLRAWDEHFRTVLGFAKMGDRETAHLLADDYLLKLCRIIAADPAVELPPNYAQMLRNIFRRLNNRPPSYQEVITTIKYLLSQLAPTLGPETIVEMPTERLHMQQKPFCWTSTEASFIHVHPEGRNYSFFVEKLLGVDQLPKETDDIIVRLAQTSDQMDASVAQAIKANVSLDASSQLVDPYLRAAGAYMESTQVASRAEKLAAHMALHAKHLHIVDLPALMSFFQGALNLERPSRQWAKRLHDYCLELIPDWAPLVLVHPSIDVRFNMTQLLNIELFQFPPDHDFGVTSAAEEGQARVFRTIQRLGIACLTYLQDAYVSRKAAIGREQAATILEIVGRCNEYYETDVADSEELLIQFHVLQEDVTEPIRRLIVEQVDEDGTDWEGSCASSDQMDGIAAELSIQAMNEMNDTDAA